MIVIYAIDVGWKHNPLPVIYERRETDDVEATRMEIWEEYTNKGYKWCSVTEVMEEVKTQ